MKFLKIYLHNVMAKSALLKSSIGKKYWMALTGLFLCLFLAGHLAGNLQLLLPDSQLQFNQYALFMTTNPAVKILSYLTYISILFHAVDGILLAIQNKKARPVGYAKNNPSANSSFASRNMAVLGTLVLVFIATHMINFWAKMHFDEKMPLQTLMIKQERKDQYTGMTIKDSVSVFTLTSGNYIPTEQVKGYGDGGDNSPYEIVNRVEFFRTGSNMKAGEGYKDLYTLTMDFFRDKEYGLAFTLFYVFSMMVLAFHLWHGFQSAFQSLGLNNPKWTPTIKFVGKAFAVIVPILFAIIPLYIHFTK